MHTIFEPKTKDEIEAYLRLRWILLRRPWGGKRGSEIDSFEKDSFNRAAKDNKNNIIGVGRIHFISNIGQIRYMGIKKAFSKQGIGTKIILALEEIAMEHQIYNIFLNSRENAIIFYKKNGYKIMNKVDSSFGDIIHYRMEKELNNS